MRREFEKIFLDISGICNAKCKWCMSGLYSKKDKGFISVELFDKVLSALKSNNAVAKNGIIALYLWGEPFLHPQLDEICRIINRYGYAYSFSTNASRVPHIDGSFIKNLDHIIFSMSGFSQRSYDREHGLNFEQVVKNIKTIVRECRSFGFKGDFIVNYHVYQFNLEEIGACESWANRQNILFSPGYAVINNWEHMNGWLEKKLGYDVLKKIAEELFCYDVDRIVGNSPEHYFCPQYDLLAINEKGEVLNCCQVPNEMPYVQGNIITDDFKDILSRRLDNEVCRKCSSSGLAYYFNNSLTAAGFYSLSISQRLSHLRAKLITAVKNPRIIIEKIRKING